MRGRCAILWILPLAFCSTPVAHGDDPLTESDEALRAIVRQALGEVEAQRDQGGSSYGATLSRLLVSIGDKEEARERMLAESAALETEYKAEAENNSQRGRTASLSAFRLVRLAESLHGAGFDDDARGLLRRAAETATAVETPQMNDYERLLEAQCKLGDREGASGTLNRALRVIEAQRARERVARERDMPGDDPLAAREMSLRVRDSEIAGLHVLAGHVEPAFAMLKALIESCEKLSNEDASNDPFHVSPWLEARIMIGVLAERVSRVLPAAEAKPRIDRLLDWNRRLPRDQGEQLELHLAQILAKIGEDGAAVRLLRTLEERSNKKPHAQPGESETDVRFRQWEDCSRRHNLWEARFVGWVALARARKERNDPGSALRAVDEAESLLRDPAPDPDTMPPPPGIPGDDEASPQPPGSRLAQAKDPEPTLDDIRRPLLVGQLAELLADLGERERALALTQLLAPRDQLLGFRPIIQALEKSEQRELADEFRRQALENMLRALAQLDATPIPEPKPITPEPPPQPKTNSGRSDRPGRPIPVPPPGSEPARGA
jgi:hypothetical protein